MELVVDLKPLDLSQDTTCEKQIFLQVHEPRVAASHAQKVGCLTPSELGAALIVETKSVIQTSADAARCTGCRRGIESLTASLEKHRTIARQVQLPFARGLT